MKGAVSMSDKIVLAKTIPGGDGISTQVKKGQYLIITDLEGAQIVDFIAFAANDFTKYMSVSHTRSTYDKYDLTVGDYIYTDGHEPMLQIIEDTCGVHDMSFPGCNKYMYAKMGISNHRSCQDNFAESLSEYDIEEWMLPDPFHFFQNSPNMQFLPNHSKPGDLIKLKFLMDAVIAVSACPYDLNGINGGKSTSIQITITEE
jgi:uncharacterized protein YcgI (DUF1989 family)